MTIGTRLQQAYEDPVLARRVMLGYLRTRLTMPGRFGAFPVFSGKIRFKLDGAASFGSKFDIEAPLAGVLIRVAPGASLTVGDNCSLASGVQLEAWHDIRIGNSVLIGAFSTIFDDDRHDIEPGGAARYRGPLVIEDNVWMPHHVTVLPGVTIGEGSVIGAYSVVSRDVPPYSFAAGSPARVIRKLDLPDGWVRH
jgi:acetyltransferase-like isoleucine patch superfamily enzyme